MRLRTVMRLTGMGRTDMELMGTDRKGMHLTGAGRMGTDNVGRRCERRSGTSDCAES
jgi:hypothetical protein